MADEMKAWVKRYDETYFCCYAIVFGYDPNYPESIHSYFQPQHWEIISSIRLDPGDGPVLLRPGSLEELVVHTKRKGAAFMVECDKQFETIVNDKESLADNPADVTCPECLKAMVT